MKSKEKPFEIVVLFFIMWLTLFVSLNLWMDSHYRRGKDKHGKIAFISRTIAYQESWTNGIRELLVKTYSTYFGIPVRIQCVAPVWCKHSVFPSLSHVKSGVNCPLAATACSMRQGHFATWKRSLLINDKKCRIPRLLKAKGRTVWQFCTEF